MKLTPIGTSAARPTATHGGSCYLLEVEGCKILFDCAEGSHALLEKAKININDIKQIYITHMHIDHVGGLPGLLNRMSSENRTRHLDVFGPVEVSDYIKATTEYTGRLPNHVKFHAIKPRRVPINEPVWKTASIDDSVLVYTGAKYGVRAITADHRGLAFSYKVVENDKPGKVNMEKVKKLGIPLGPNIGKLQSGKEITHDGKIIKPSDVLGPTQKGDSFGYSGDTRKLKKLERFFSKCSILLHEATYLIGSLERAKHHGHSTATDAAQTAKYAKIDKLVLTHFSTKYETRDGHLAEARRYHKNTILAEDLVEITN